MDAALRAEVRRLARQEMWRRGHGFELVCDDGQREWVKAAWESDGDSVWMISRQRGKSFAFVGLADHVARTVDGAIVRYAAKTKESAEGILRPNLEMFFQGCPERLRPEEDGHTWVWPNGSRLHWAGTDNQTFDRLRGPRSHLIGLDESAFYSDLERVEAALLPSLQTTGGICLYLSTPPESPAHPFAKRWQAAQAAGRGRHDTIWGNPRLGQDGAERYLRKEAERLGIALEDFKKTTYYRREYLAELVTEESRAAVPGWSMERQAALVKENTKPAHFDVYAGFDFGFGDPHAALWMYLDFHRQVVVVERELELRAANTAKLAEEVRAIEAEHYPQGVFARFGDNDPLVLADLHQQHRILVQPSRKDEKQLQLNQLDAMVRGGKLEIDPRCVRLIEQLYTTTWNLRRTDYERTDKDHGDLLDALVYGLRNIHWHKNPFPVGWNVGAGQYLPLAAKRALQEQRQTPNIGAALTGNSPLARRLAAKGKMR